MGANQSTASGGNTANPGGPKVKTCYYDLLDISKDATEDEIKKAYRRKALELHPDRNLANVDTTTKQFAEVQSAYEVLADPQERAWYDSHRDAILRDEEEVDRDHYEHNIRVTTADDILRIFRDFNGQRDFSDEPTGFFTVLCEVFQDLAREEEVACAWEGLEPAQYPSFGSAKDSYEATVRPFYTVWTNFATQKTFAWKDAYRYAEAPDRRIRRLMEKENKRLRGEGVREFNDAVQSLVAFVKKRDPRVKSTKENETERQKTLRDAATAQAARSRAINQAKAAQPSAVPDWVRSNEPVESEVTDEEDSALQVEELECVLCRKSFKSEKQYEAHERSKKHIKAVQLIRKDILRENVALDQNCTPNSSLTAQHVKIDLSYSIERKHIRDSSGDFTHTPSGRRVLNEEPGSDAVVSSAPSTPSEFQGSDLTSTSFSEYQFGDEYISRESAELHVLGTDAEEGALSSDHRAISLDGLNRRLTAQNPSKDTQPKLGKAKAKRKKKAAVASATNESDSKCTTCQADFPSHSKLFNHINSLGHGQSMPKAAKGGKRKKK